MRHSPQTPYRVKAKGKENKPGFLKNSLSPRACAHARGLRRKEAAERYDLAGAAAAELTRILGVEWNKDDIQLWAWYCYHYHHDIDTIIERAYRCASRCHQGEIDNAVTSFQHWLDDTYKKEGAR